MNLQRNKLLTNYQHDLIRKQSRLAEIEDILPDYDFLPKSRETYHEYGQLLKLRQSLSNEIDSLQVMIAELKDLSNISKQNN